MGTLMARVSPFPHAALKCYLIQKWLFFPFSVDLTAPMQTGAPLGSLLPSAEFSISESRTTELKAAEWLGGWMPRIVDKINR